MNHVIVVVPTRLSDLHKDVTADALVRSLLRADGMLLVTLQTRVVVMITLVIMVEIPQRMAEIGTTSTGNAAQPGGVVAHPHHEASMTAGLAAPNGSSLTIQFPKEASKVCFFPGVCMGVHKLTVFSSQPHPICWWRNVRIPIVPIIYRKALTHPRCSDQELRRIFDQFGRVQTCIVNKDKRHAFVKMVSRQDAITAKEAMEGSRNPDSSLRVRSVNSHPQTQVYHY